MPVIESAALKSDTRPTDDLSQARNRTLKASLNLKIVAGLAPTANDEAVGLERTDRFEFIDQLADCRRLRGGTIPGRCPVAPPEQSPFDSSLILIGTLCSIAIGSPPNRD
jgi:hypothetical protein